MPFGALKLSALGARAVHAQRVEKNLMPFGALKRLSADSVATTAAHICDRGKEPNALRGIETQFRVRPPLRLLPAPAAYSVEKNLMPFGALKPGQSLVQSPKSPVAQD